MSKIFKANNRVLAVKRPNGDWHQPVPVLHVPDANTILFTTAAGIVDESLITTVNMLVVLLKNTGIWNKLLAIYPMVGGTERAHKFNLKDARNVNAAYRLTFVNNVVHDDIGVNWNGVSYAVTHLDLPSTASASIGYYTTRASTTPNDVAIGTSVNVCEFYLQQKNGDSNSVYASFSTYALTGRFTTGLLQGATHLGMARLYHNGILANSSICDSATIAADIYINGYHQVTGVEPTASTNAPCSFAYIGNGLSEAENLSLYNIIQDFQASLYRAVYTPPLGYTGIVAPAPYEEPVSVLYNDPRITKAGQWGLFNSLTGMTFCQNAARDGSVFLQIQVYAFVATTVDFYLWKDAGADAGTFDVQVDNVTIGAPVSVWNGVNDYRDFKMASVVLTPGTHSVKIRLAQNIRPDVTQGNSIYFHEFRLSTS